MKCNFKKKYIIIILLILFISLFLIGTNINLNQKTTEFPDIQISEQETEKGKIITISAPDELNYENVLGYTELSKEAPAEKIHFYHLTEQTKQEIEIEKYDENNNGLIDYIEWTVPHLSKQTYELIIEISRAEHLDENRNFISDIYNEVKEQDNIWSKSINSNEYVRVTFEQELTNKNDITIYPRIITGNPKIEVYEFESNELIAEFSLLNNNEYNKVFLKNLISESQDVFDLKVINGIVEFDHIIDPTTTSFEDDFEINDWAKWSSHTNMVYDGTRTQGGSNWAAAILTSGATITGDLTSIAIDLSEATSFNFSVWYNEDDLEAADATLSFYDNTSAWDAITAIEATTLACTEDTWCFYSYSTSDSQYLHSGFMFKFDLNPDKNENIWLDTITLNKTVTLDETPPYFTTIPADASLSEGESLSVDFDAADGVGFDSFAINWSNTFNIDSSTGGLTNTSALSVGSYSINVTINDTSNNLNSTIYGVTVSSNTCTKPESGNWPITCSDNCTWTEDFTVPDNITITGSGTLTWNANMSFTKEHWEIYKDDGCELVINPGGSIQ